MFRSDAVRYSGFVLVLTTLLLFSSNAFAASLHKAAKKGNVAKIEELIRNGTSLNAIDRKGQTPLHYAVLHGHADAVEVLLENGAQVHVRNRSGETPYQIADTSGAEIIVRPFIKSFCHYASRRRIEEFLATGIDPNVKCGGGQVGLHIAAKSGYRPAVQMLLDHGAQVNIADNSGYTPLHYAAEAGDTDIVQLLLSSDADSHQQDLSGNTPLHLAALHGREQTVNLLIRIDGAMTVRNQDGETPLRMAAKSGHVKLIHVLLDIERDDAFVKSQDGAKTLLLLVRESVKKKWNTKTIKFEHGEPNWPKLVYVHSDPDRKGFMMIIQDLLKAGVDPNSYRYKGFKNPTGGPVNMNSSGLSITMSTEYADGSDGIIVEASLGGLSVLQLATRQEASDIAELLRSAGAK